MSPLIKATGVLFDWDGTLLNSFRLSYHASIKVLQHFGIKINQKRIADDQNTIKTLSARKPNLEQEFENLKSKIEDLERDVDDKKIEIQTLAEKVYRAFNWLNITINFV